VRSENLSFYKQKVIIKIRALRLKAALRSGLRYSLRPAKMPSASHPAHR